MASLFRSRIWTLLPIRKCRVTNRRAAAGRIPYIAGKRRNKAEARAVTREEGAGGRPFCIQGAAQGMAMRPQRLRLRAFRR